MIYDYYGFPKEAYDIQYPAPGAPELAEEILTLFETSDVEARLDDERGFDHGLYVPLLLMYPNADIPCIQISLQKNLDASAHIRIGEALSGLKSDNVLIVGSGFSFHNMKAFAAMETRETTQMNHEFEAWLNRTCSDETIDETERRERLVGWESAPFARYCHPREEHLLPLHVCYGMAGQPCRTFQSLTIMNKKASLYCW